MTEKEVSALIQSAKKSGVSLATVESCTGGLIARRLTAIAGSSEVFWGGFITYDNSAKELMVGVPAELLKLKGAVSAEVAGLMAENGLTAMSQAIESSERSSVASAKRRICVSTTGIAGPGGGAADKPVGLCYVGIAASGLPTAVIELRQPEGQTRELNQNAFSDSALAAVSRLVKAFAGTSVLFAAFSFLALSASASPIHLELETGIPHQQVSLATDFMEWQPWVMTEDRPGHYVYSFEEPWETEVAYKFIVDGAWIADPANPLSSPDGHGGSNSRVEVAGFHEDPWLALLPGMSELRRADLQLTDLEGSPRTITIVGARDGRPSVTVYFQDGGDFLDRTGAVALLANLSAQPGLPAFTGVFIPPKDRMREYEFLPAYADFVTTVVVPAVEAWDPVTGGSRTRRVLVGPSLGGLVTLYTALRSPGVFAYAASQSASLWFQDGALVKTLGAPVTDPSLALKLFMDCGTYEDPDMAKYNRLGSEAARTAGHSVVYHEHPSTHDWIAWRNELQPMLRYFFTGTR
jgi:nicotinamide-nucleotide amidase